MPHIIGSVLSLILSSFHLNGDYQSFQYACGLAFLCIPLSLYIAKRLGVTFAVLCAYTGISAMAVIWNFHAKYQQYPFEIQNSVSIGAAFSLLVAMMMLFAVLEMPKKWLDSFRTAIPLYTVLDACYIISHRFMHWKLNGGYGYQGVIDYCGMSGVKIALGCAFLIPIAKDTRAMRSSRLIGLLICFWAIALSHSAITFGVLGVILSSRIRIKNPHWQTLRLWPLAACICVGVSVVGHKMVDSSHRFTAYEVFLSWLFRERMDWFGAGLGTFKVWAPTIQWQAKFMIDRSGGWVWPVLHSDWLEIFFCLGAVGFILSLLTYLVTLFKNFAQKDLQMLSFGLGIGASACFDFPLRYMSTGFFVAYYIVMSLSKTSEIHYIKEG